MARPKKDGEIQQPISWRPRTKELGDKWREIGASRWLNRILEELRLKDEVPPDKPKTRP
jgi:hypothetical protein